MQTRSQFFYENFVIKPTGQTSSRINKSCIQKILTMLLFTQSSIGLAFSLYPDIIIGRMNLWSAASATNSLLFTFVGTVITLPLIIAYTIFIYRIFHGKASDLSYGSDSH